MFVNLFTEEERAREWAELVLEGHGIAPPVPLEILPSGLIEDEVEAFDQPVKH